MDNASRRTPSRYTDPIEILTTPVTTTTVWQDVKIIDSRSFREMCLFLRITINSGKGLELRIVGLEDKDSTTEYKYPLYLSSESGTVIGSDVFIIKDNIDQNIMFDTGVSPAGYSKIQVRSTIAGVSITSLLMAVTQ